jgi:hypothetical protein
MFVLWQFFLLEQKKQEEESPAWLVSVLQTYEKTFFNSRMKHVWACERGQKGEAFAFVDVASYGLFPLPKFVHFDYSTLNICAILSYGNMENCVTVKAILRIF